MIKPRSLYWKARSDRLPLAGGPNLDDVIEATHGSHGIDNRVLARNRNGQRLECRVCHPWIFAHRHDG